MFGELSIRTVLGGTIVTMGMLLLLTAGFSLRSAIERNNAAQRVVALAAIDGHVFDAMLAMRVERDTILGSPITPTPAVARMTDNCAESEANYAAAAPLLSNAALATPELAGSVITVAVGTRCHGNAAWQDRCHDPPG